MAAAATTQNMGRRARGLRCSGWTTFPSRFFSDSGTKGAVPEGAKDSRGDGWRSARFVKGVGGWSEALSSPGVASKAWSGAAGVDGMLSSGAGLDMGRGEEGEEGGTGKSAAQGDPPIYTHVTKRLPSGRSELFETRPAHVDRSRASQEYVALQAVFFGLNGDEHLRSESLGRSIRRHAFVYGHRAGLREYQSSPVHSQRTINLRIMYNMVCSEGSYGNLTDSYRYRDQKRSVHLRAQITRTKGGGSGG